MFELQNPCLTSDKHLGCYMAHIHVFACNSYGDREIPWRRYSAFAKAKEKRGVGDDRQGLHVSGCGKMMTTLSRVSEVQVRCWVVALGRLRWVVGMGS
jgi:hypothetical protein